MEAAAILERAGALPGTLVFGAQAVRWILERARLHRRLGNREQAVRDYSRVAAFWQTADDVLQPFVTEAREAIAALTQEQ